MNWYYVEQGKQTGPVSDEQLDEMARNGRITPDTLVWREGMADWIPCREVRAQLVPAAIGSVEGETKSQTVCSECGKMFPAEETIRYGNVSVCAACKPIFLQKLQEGASLNTGDLHYAGFWIRFVASILDGVSLGVELFATAFQLLAGVSYEAFMVGKYGATVGKMAVKIKVVTADGGRVSYARAVGRYFAKILSGCPTLFIGFIIVGFDNPQKRALHDHLCNTRVVYK